jgi:hypothetical protein
MYVRMRSNDCSVNVLRSFFTGKERRGGGLAKLLNAYSDRHSSTSMELDLINRDGVSLTVQVRTANLLLYYIYSCKSI